MKNFKFLLFLLLSIGLCATACQKEEEDPTNFFNLNGEELTLTKGFIESIGTTGNDIFDVDISFGSSEISYVNDDFVGTGDGIYLDLNTSQSPGLKEGTYNFSATRDDFTISFGMVAKNFDFGTLTGEDYSVTGGSATVAIDGTVYTVDFDLTIANGSRVTGNYTGSMQEI